MGFFTSITSLEEVPQFEVNKVDIFDAQRRKLYNTYSLQRSDTHENLGIVRSNYRPIQMEEMIDVLDTASEEVGGIDHVAYSEYKSGRAVIIQSKLQEQLNVDGDIVDPYFYTVIDNSGGGANKTIPSSLRIRCTNALHLINCALSARGLHNATFDQKVHDMIDGIVHSVESARNFENTMKSLKSQKFTMNQMVEFTERLIPIKEKDSKQRVTKREKLVGLFSNGMGNVGESRWDALNAVTEYETHTGKKTSEKFFRELGSQHTMSKKALDILAYD